MGRMESKWRTSTIISSKLLISLERTHRRGELNGSFLDGVVQPWDGRVHVQWHRFDCRFFASCGTFECVRGERRNEKTEKRNKKWRRFSNVRGCGDCGEEIRGVYVQNSSTKQIACLVPSHRCDPQACFRCVKIKSTIDSWTSRFLHPA